MFGINEDIWGPAEVGPGTYIFIAVVVLMVLQAAPAFLREVLPAVRLYPYFVGGIAFWWLAFTGRPLLGFLALVAGVVAVQLLAPSEKERTTNDPARKE